MRFIYHISILILVLIAARAETQPGQLTINRVELMPNQPSPYNMRDWLDVARKYDAFVFDTSKTGQYLPLSFIVPAGISYPERPTFGLHSYVGTVNPNSGEGINVLPAIIGASLAGIDKSNQDGTNWVLMAQDYFNKNSSELIYLNNRGGSSGNDWWYDMMPNIYFYQLYDLYGPIGDAEFQFHSVAMQMHRSVQHMGGSDTPWNRASMNYRAWKFATMEPNDQGVIEPEAAGAYAWLLYHAYRKTGNPEYLKGAEWSMEFLSALGTNPSYELQLPYGAFIAARMNAELHTSYPVEKLLFWVFNRGPLRGWGNIVGTWGGLDVSGLVGEANDNGNDYAFQMNAVQQAAAIVPLVRYDKRYARTIGKWFLNMSNATRLMFPGFLPASHQDASEWSEIHDPDAVIGYEALREVWQGTSPFSTGDATGGGWAGTNLALYGTSSIGYLGGLMRTTDQEKILLIDLLKTDFFHDEAYPSYLLYNPYPDSRDVTIGTGTAPVDIYDVLTETFIATGVSGNTTITIPADQAVSIVLAPAGGSMEFVDNKLLINGVVVDYMQNQQAWNAKPRIQALAVLDTNVQKQDTIEVFGTAIDLETKNPVFEWSASGGEIIGDEETIQWVAPAALGDYTITLIVHDEDLRSDTAVIILHVVEEVNIPPVIEDLSANKRHTVPGGKIELVCLASDLNGDLLNYEWSASSGTFQGSGSSVTWTGPAEEGIHTITARVTDSQDASDQAQLRLLTYIFGDNSAAAVIANYPFNGNALDASGNDLHGDVKGAKLTDDRNEIALNAYFFDGVNDHISVSNSDKLNFTEGITLSCWIKPGTLPDRETFVLSHGSWQNRWKVSVIPDHRIRWTLKTSTGQIRDLDSETIIQEDEWYHIAVTYDGKIFLIYIDGNLESFSSLNGEINSTVFDLEIGQMLPDDQSYNFRGTIDDILIYNQALTPDSIATLADKSSSYVNTPAALESIKAWPNPTTGILNIASDSPGYLNDNVSLRIYDINGNLRKTLEHEMYTGQIRINISDLAAGIYLLDIEANGRKGYQRIVKYK